MTQTNTNDSDHVFDIKTVCQLTGLNSANLRSWEKRYEVVAPIRSETGRRQYSREDVQKLTLLKTLCDLGHSISSSAQLPMAELERRVADSAGAPVGTQIQPDGEESDKSHACRISTVGELSTLLDESGIFYGRAVKVAEFPDLDHAERSAVSGGTDLLIIECPAMFCEDLAKIRNLIKQTGALRAVVIYVYTQGQTFESLVEDDAQITAIRAPVSAAELKIACATDIALTNRSTSEAIKLAPGPPEKFDGVPPREFSPQQLAELARHSTTIECECPHQMVSVLTSLNAFELYSKECESRSVADAEIHDYLHRMTAHARSTIEQALKVLVEFENIDITKA